MDENASQRPAGVKPRPQLTKAERRELQENQKAAKAAKNTNAPGPIKPSPSSTSDRPRKSFEGKPVARAKSAGLNSIRDTASVASADTENVLKDLRIFSHFVPSGKSSAASKVEIHPAIQRLALQFSEFRIVGGNARCVATVIALKEVHK